MPVMRVGIDATSVLRQRVLGIAVVDSMSLGAPAVVTDISTDVELASQRLSILTPLYLVQRNTCVVEAGIRARVENDRRSDCP